jgi:hypothetical protein
MSKITMSKNLGLVVALMLVVAAPAGGATSGGPSYSATGTYTPPVIVACGADGCPPASFDGSLSCSAFCTGVPGSASFSLKLNPGDPYNPSDPYRFKTAQGDLSVSWSDSTSSLASVRARARDHKAYVLGGTVISGRFAGYMLSGWVSTPADASQAASFVGELTFVPPNPI